MGTIVHAVVSALITTSYKKGRRIKMVDSRYLNYFFMIVAGMMIFSNFFVTIEGNLQFIGLKNAVSVDCNGSLEIYTNNPNLRRRIINHAQREVRKMRPLHDFSNSELFVKVNGNCCWKLFQRNYFRGTSDVLVRGDEREFSFYPKSLRLVECPSRA